MQSCPILCDNLLDLYLFQLFGVKFNKFFKTIGETLKNNLPTIERPNIRSVAFSINLFKTKTEEVL